jgi:hypothetical protein
VIRSRPAEQRRRGFVLLLVLGVFAIAVATIGWNINRMNVFTTTVESRVRGYHAHHEALGLRDIAGVWLSRVTRGGAGVPVDADEALAALAASPEADFELAMPEGRLVRFWLRDGQGTLLANLSAPESPQQRELALRTLERLPETRPDLIRMAGPWRMSVRALDDELIFALAAGDTNVITALRDARDDPQLEPSMLNSRLASRGVNLADHRTLVEALTLEPVLWAVDVEVTDLEGSAARPDTRWYQMLIELGRTQSRVHDWTRLTEAEFRERREGAESFGGA